MTMLFQPSFTVGGIDPSLGKLDAASMSQQTLMELLVADIHGRMVFTDSEKNFKDISCWEGVGLDQSGEVISINWNVTYGSGMVGGFMMDDDVEYFNVRPGGTIDLQWLPSALSEFAINEIELKGSIDTFGLPRHLEIFTVAKNEFYGNFDIKGLPVDIRTIDISTNELDGPLNLAALPRRLQEFLGFSNAFSGNLDFANLPQSLMKLMLSNNRFSGNIDLSILPTALCQLALERNVLGQDALVICSDAVETITISVDYGKFPSITDTHGNTVVGDVLYQQVLLIRK